jgi:RHS repeat-associated protein
MEQAGAAIVEYIRLAGAMVAKIQSGSTQYRQSTRMTLDSGGNVIGRQAHLAFGEDFAESGTQEKHHFTSYERDAESGQDYAVNRFHNFSVGRFTSADRATGTPSNPQSWNRYSYGSNDPVNRSDQAGLDDDELPFYELSLDDIFALVDGGGGDYGFSDFLDVFGGGDDAFIEPIGPDPSLLEPLLGPHESIDASAGDDSFIDPLCGFVGIGFGGGGFGGEPEPQARRGNCAPGDQDQRVHRTSDSGIQFLRTQEGSRRRPYNDSANNCTIGVGHMLHPGPCTRADRLQYRNGISEAQTTAFLTQDVTTAEGAVNSNVNVPLSQNQFDAL